MQSQFNRVFEMFNPNIINLKRSISSRLMKLLRWSNSGRKNTRNFRRKYFFDLRVLINLFLSLRNCSMWCQ